MSGRSPLRIHRWRVWPRGDWAVAGKVSLMTVSGNLHAGVLTIR